MSRTFHYDDTLGFVPDDDVPQKLCINCKSHCVWAGKDGEPEHKKCLVGYTPITNADRIRAMSDEELAKYLDGVCHDLWQMFVKDPQKMWLNWLKQSAEEGE